MAEVFKTIFEDGACKAKDPEAFATFLCDIIQLGEFGCDSCPVTDLCCYGHNGFKDLLKMSPSVFKKEDIWKEWKKERHEV